MDDDEEEGEATPAYPFRWAMVLVWLVRLVAGITRAINERVDEIETDVIASYNHMSYQRLFENEARAEIESIPTTQE